MKEIPEPKRLRSEDHEFKASLHYIVPDKPGLQDPVPINK